MKPGEYLLNGERIVLNASRKAVELTVKNTDRRPLQVGSHFHFFEANRALSFDRKKAFGKRLDIPSATAVRFEPEEEKKVRLISLGGRRGEANGSIPTVQPIMGKYMFGGFGKAIDSGSITFVSQYSYETDIGKNLGLQKKILPVKNRRQIAKRDMIYNTWVPKIEVDYKTYEVRANGELPTCAPAAKLPLTQRYFLF